VAYTPSVAAQPVATAETVAEQPALPKTLTNERYRFAVAVPAGCRHDAGPGTLDAVCAPGFDPKLSARASSATALLMQVGAEMDGPAQEFTERTFRDELPETVCGENDPARARIDSVQRALQDARTVYTANVICAEVQFLQIPERRARVKYVIGPEVRYRLLARAPIESFEKQKHAIEAFFESFRVLPAESTSQ
jgi:hypothetical protein